MLKAIGFDLFGTLLRVKGDQTACLNSMHTALCSHGIDIPLNQFLEIYRSVHAGNREIRTSTRREISNREELSQILNQLGYSIKADAPQITEAVSAYFAPWTATVIEGAASTLFTLRKLKGFKIGVVTNFTDQTFILQSLRNHNLLDLLDCVVVSAEVGWRKPDARMFDRLREFTGARADEILFVGDDADSDIVGAKAAGMRAVLVAGESYNREGGHAVQPDYTTTSIRELSAIIRKIEEEIEG